MNIKITPEIKNILYSLGNKTAVSSGLKIYATLYSRSYRKNTKGYFDCPSTLLRSVNSRYSKIIKRLLDEGIIDYLKTQKIDPNDIFHSITSKTYSSHMGYCMKYKFLVDVSIGEEIEIDMSTGRKERWYEITANSLIELGYVPDIKRDSFGRRVHYPLLNNYKEELKGKGLCVIDAKTSQPRLLYLLMKERNIIDPIYSHAFESDIDFYDFIVTELKLKDRDAAKDLFMQWINSRGFVNDFQIKRLFPIANHFINGLKSRYYKDSAAFLQRAEAKIWIDDLLQNIPAEFALPVHDSLIVRQENLINVLDYCKTKYPDLRFSNKEL